MLNFYYLISDLRRGGGGSDGEAIVVGPLRPRAPGAWHKMKDDQRALARRCNSDSNSIKMPLFVGVCVCARARARA